MLAWIGCRIGKPPGWERIVRRLASPVACARFGEVCLIREGLAFLTRPSVPIGWHVAFFGTYEPELREVFLTVLPAGGTAIDVGANVGWHTLLMARLVGDGGRVLAVEPNPSVRRGLQANLALNGFGNVDIVPCALAERDTMLRFLGPGADDPESGNGHVIRDGIETGGLVLEVQGRRLDDVVAEAGLDRVDLIKIDVEGFEWPALLGAEQTIARFRPHIVFEFDAAYTSRGAGNAALLAEFFQRHGYRLFDVKRTWAEAVRPGSWPECANIWAVPSHFGGPHK